MIPYYQSYGNYDEFCEHAVKLPFVDYIAYCQTYIKNIRQRAGLPHDAETLSMNSPFELRPAEYNGERAVLLVHGFLASPYMMRALGEFFAAQGFLVRAILLPGHGSSPGELCAARGEHWQMMVNYGIQSLQIEAKQIHLAGYSLGATLVSLAAFDHPVTSLMLLAPAHGITYFANLLPFFFMLNRYTKLNLLSWVLRQTQDDLVSYRSYPSSSVNEVRKLVSRLQTQLARTTLNLPCFIIATFEDSTVNPQQTLALFKRHSNPGSRLLLYSRKSRKFSDSRITVIVSAALEKQVHELSHIAIPIAPDDPYYGRNGKYYGSVADDTYFGEKNFLNARNKKYKRLTYHPGFQTMLHALKGFLNSLSGIAAEI